MILTIRPGEPLGRALGRLAGALLGRAADALNDEREQASERIHVMRTSLKRVRALMRLARRLARPKERRELRRAERRLRDLARHTATVRDAEVVVQTLDGVIAAQPGVVKPKTVEQVRRELLERFRRAEQVFHAPEPAVGARRPADDRLLAEPGRASLRALAGLLMQERRLTDAWALSRPRSWSKAADRIADGMTRTYRRARRYMSRAYNGVAAQQLTGQAKKTAAAAHDWRQTGAAFHEWRKAVKAHRHQLHLLSDTWPVWVTARLPELERLGQLLGEEHDLTVLSQTLSACPTCFGDPLQLESVLAVLAARQQQLRDEARPLGETLFRQRTRLFRRQVHEGMRPTHAERPAASGAVPRSRGGEAKLTAV
ncbi:MAG: CHAD domain-containing protein [Polyangia bacterium]